MGVKILGLMHNAIGPGEDMILARLEGAEPEYSGVVAGMSGSPVYIDGKLVGAIAYRIGEFSKEPICGITPIGQMLQNRARGAELTAQVRGQNFAAGGVNAGDSNTFRAIDAPLVFSGFPHRLWRYGASMRLRWG